MLNKLITKFIGSRNERLVKKLGKVIHQVSDHEPLIKNLSDEELKAKTAELRSRQQDGESLDALLPEAFTIVREASQRTLGLRHYDVQLVGGVVLHRGMITEMKTGEGKTLMATLAVYLNSLTGRGVHVVTVNDYLARRDADWMRPIYDAPDLTINSSTCPMPSSVRNTCFCFSSMVKSPGPYSPSNSEIISAGSRLGII